MRLSLVFYVFLVRMAVGTLIALLPNWRLRAAERHLRLEAVLAFSLAGLAAFLYSPALGDDHPGAPRGLAAFASLGGGMPGTVVLFLVACLAVNLLFGLFERRAGRAVLVAGIAVGLAAVWGTARLTVPSYAFGPTLVVATAGVLGGMLMACVNDAMILGHFYLVIRGLPVDALKRAGRFTAAVILARLAVFGVVLLSWDGAADMLLGREVIWTSWRIAFGFVGPLALLWLVKDTVRLKNTQAATGLLYVAVGFALMGELAAVFLETQTGIPT